MALNTSIPHPTLRIEISISKIKSNPAHYIAPQCNDYLRLLFFFRWQGPLSIAVYAPGTDFQKAIDSILYYRFLPVLLHFVGL